MKNLILRVCGFCFVLIAAVSLGVSLVLIFETWSLRQPVTDDLASSLDLITATLTTTSSGLTTVDQTLSVAMNNLRALQATTLVIASTISDTAHSIDVLSKIINFDIPATLISTQLALGSAESSARTIDQVLQGLASIPLIGIDYQPQVPLDQAVHQVALSMEAFPTSFSNMTKDLLGAAINLRIMENRIRNQAKELDPIFTTLNDARAVVAQYQQQTEGYLKKINSARAGLVSFSLTLAWVITFILIWLVIVQVRLAIKALTWLLAVK